MPVYLTFQTDSEEIGNATDSDITPGSALSELLECSFASKGIAIKQAVDDYEDYGWEFIAKVNDVHIYCMLQLSDEWMVIIEPQIPFLKLTTILKPNSEVGQFCSALDQFLHSDPKIRNVEWSPRNWHFVHGTGCPTPNLRRHYSPAPALRQLGILATW